MNRFTQQSITVGAGEQRRNCPIGGDVVGHVDLNGRPKPVESDGVEPLYEVD
jgi:hypothetical protein